MSVTFASSPSTPTANALQLATVFSVGTGAVATMTGRGLTWELVHAVAYNAIDMEIWRAVGASPTSAAMGVTWTVTPYFVHGPWVTEATGAPSGSNGAAAIGNVGDVTAYAYGAGVSPTYGSSDSRVFTAFQVRGTGGNPQITGPAGTTLFGDFIFESSVGEWEADEIDGLTTQSQVSWLANFNQQFLLAMIWVEILGIPMTGTIASASSHLAGSLTKPGELSGAIRSASSSLSAEVSARYNSLTGGVSSS